jgi:hypothetical protein
MSALIIVVTDAGRAAQVNADHDGTLPVRVASIGVTAIAFSPSKTQLTIPGEIKRLATIKGGAVAPDTLHVTIRDDSTDTYSVRGIGFYLADGTLFAVYGQTDVLLEKSSQATMLLAGDVQFADILAASLSFGDTDFQLSAATTEIQGIVELATDAETIAGTDTQRAVVPHGLMAALDDRLGVAAPATFVKTLLNKISALAFVTALGIRGAASFDPGSGNGLDADMVDGQHGAYYLDYHNFSNVPLTFAPAAHQHSAADITSGTLVVARGGSGAATFTAGSYLLGSGTGAFAVKTPAQVLTDIGAAAVVHSHPISDIISLQTSLDARPLQASVTTQISAAINGLINGSPGALDTLKELADAMGDDPNFAATITNALATKLPLSGGNLTGNLGITGGTLNITRGAADYNAVSLTNTGGASVQLDANGNTEGNLRTTTNHPLTFMTNNVLRATIDVSGNFGIGATPTGVTGIGNPVQGAHNLVMYNVGDIGVRLLTDNAAGRNQFFSFGAAGVGTLDAGLTWNSSTRAMSLWTGAAVRLTLDVNGNATFAGALTVTGATTLNGSVSTGTNTVTSTWPWTTGTIANGGGGGTFGFTCHANNNGGAAATSAAAMTFLRDGVFGAYFGLDTDNQFKVGGWSFGNVSYRVVHEGLGALAMAGTITSGGYIAAGGYLGANRGGAAPQYPLDVLGSGNGRLLVRGSNANDLTIDAVTASNGAYAPMNFSASVYTFAGGGVNLASLAASGAITGASVHATGTIMAAGGFQVG